MCLLSKAVMFQVGFIVLVSLASIQAVSVSKNLRTCKTERSVRSTNSDAFTEQEAQEIVDQHNEYRGQVEPEAADMRYMNWDEPLANMAQQYAELCIWDHGQVENNTSSFSPIGQNLWLGGGTPDNFASGVSATYAWYNEYKFYNYTTRECSKACGHYTQVVWADSYAIGCGRQFCETAVEPSVPDSSPKKDVWLIVCNYGLAGNYNRHPYEAGPSCTKCASGSGECYNGQCRPCSEHNEECECKQLCKNCGTLNEDCTCTCQNGFEGVDCSNVCEDRHKYCGAGWYPAQCSFYQPAIDRCPKMCGSCVGRDPDFVCDETS